MAESITNLKTLKINKLTEEQYQQALADGLINENEIYLTPAESTPEVTDIPTKTSELENDSGFITEDDLPSVPTKTSELENDSNFVTEDDLKDISVPVPTKTSELENDSGFITEIVLSHDGNGNAVIEGANVLDDRSDGKARIETSEQIATLEPNKLYVFPQMTSLEVVLGGVIDISIVQEYTFRFTSGETATTLILPQTVRGEITIEANTVYEVSIVDNYLLYQSWAVS